jgi:hypothetical protein
MPMPILTAVLNAENGYATSVLIFLAKVNITVYVRTVHDKDIENTG